MTPSVRTRPVSLRIALFIFAAMICGAFSHAPPKPDSRVRLELLPNAQVLRVVGRSHLEFVADLLWIRMANMAGRAVSVSECAALLPIGHLIADLAPLFKYPYFVGGTLAPVRQWPSKHYDNAPEAVALMARGTAAVPDYVRLAVQKAYSEMEMLGDKRAAARTLMAAAKAPGAPPYVGALATRLLADQGEFEDARVFAQELAQSDDPQVRADFEIRLLQINLEQVLVGVDEAAARYLQAQGVAPQSVQELVEKGFLSAWPVDPLGGQIELTPDGARSTVETRRLKAFVPLE